MSGTRLSLEESKLLTKVMTLGASTGLPITLTPGELAKLIGIIYDDTGNLHLLRDEAPLLYEEIAPPCAYYSIPPTWFTKPLSLVFEHVDLLRLGARQIADFDTYLRCLSELHKRRLKYGRILSAQPMPTMVQVSPRALVEYGDLDPEALASWLTWRKFFYDLDNRSAQETGYLFEPVLAAAIGGEPKGAKAKVVRRSEDSTKGRQVDCWKVQIDGKPLAYEFKLRVTIAASGQGRFGEELSFADDCANSGALPVLVVLDPTPNPRLRELQAAFEAKGGKAYVGDAAWKHLEDEAGDVMSIFIERYVRGPINAISRYESTTESRLGLRLLDLEACSEEGRLSLRLGPHRRVITRIQNTSLEAGAFD